jgi:hypothetical protein
MVCCGSVNGTYDRNAHGSAGGACIRFFQGLFRRATGNCNQRLLFLARPLFQAEANPARRRWKSPSTGCFMKVRNHRRNQTFRLPRERSHCGEQAERNGRSYADLPRRWVGWTSASESFCSGWLRGWHAGTTQIRSYRAARNPHRLVPARLPYRVTFASTTFAM